jgi:hypothetical protein
MIGVFYDGVGGWKWQVWWAQLETGHHGRYFIFRHRGTDTWDVLFDPLDDGTAAAIRGTFHEDDMSATVRAHAIALGAIAA